MNTKDILDLIVKTAQEKIEFYGLSYNQAIYESINLAIENC